MLPRRISQADLAGDPYAVWNAYVQLLSFSDITDLDDIQRPAHLAFRYESEVQNGGHLQYFLNQRVDHVQLTLSALEAVGAWDHRRILADAFDLWRSKERDRPSDPDEYATTAQLDEFSKFDAAFHAGERSLIHELEEYLYRNLRHFVVIEC